MTSADVVVIEEGTLANGRVFTTGSHIKEMFFVDYGIERSRDLK